MAKETKKSKSGLIVALVSLVVLLSGAVIFLFHKNMSAEEEMSEMVELMNYEKEQLEDEYNNMSLEIEGVSMKINNDSILSLLDKEQKRVQLLLEELRSVKATNARRISELKAELASVRKVLVYYVAQVDSLSAVNVQLKEENQIVHQRFQAATEEAKVLAEEKAALTHKVTIASQLEALNIDVEVQNERGRKVRSVRKAAVIAVNYTIGKNITATPGNKTIYMRITTPDESVLYKDVADTFFFEDSEIQFSSSKKFEYTGEEFTDTIYYTVTETLWEGDYRVDLFVDSHLIGSQNFSLGR